MHRIPTLPDMIRATRLTRQGRLTRSTAVLQDLLRGGVAADAANVAARVMGATPEANRAARFPTDASRAPSGDPRFLTAEFDSVAGHRRYKLYVPSRYRGESVPLVVMLHGCTQSPDDFAAGTRMNEFAEQHGFLVAYPAQPVSANAQKCWNWFRPGDQGRSRGEPALIAGITHEIMQHYAVDKARVYVAGLSAGGAAAAIMGAAYPDLYAAIGVHSGLACGVARDVASAFSAMRQGGAAPAVAPPGRVGLGPARIVPTIVFHADRDSTVHPANGDQVMAQAAGSAADDLRTAAEDGQVPGGHRYRRTVYTDPAGNPMLEQWIIHGGGHAWSGGDAHGSYTDPRGPDASQEMLRFFFAHRHPAARTSDDRSDGLGMRAPPPSC